jgi:selenocysteine-specific elongation factor
VSLDGGLVLAAASYAAIADAARGTVARRAAEHPLQPALPASEVVPAGPARDAIVARLEEDGVLVRDAAGVRAPDATARSEAAADAARALLERLGEAPFAPPRLDEALAELALADPEARALVAVLEREGRIVRLGDGLAVTRAAYDEAVSHVRAGCEAAGSYTLAELRDATGSSRRYAQALLERMDRDGLTRRVGDARVLRRAGRAG